jgi:hypothetical protein
MESRDIVTQVDDSMITSLREAVRDCGDRGLQFASKWSVSFAGRGPQRGLISYRAAELLVSIPHQKLFAVPSGPFDATTAPFASTPARPRTVPITDMEPNLPPNRHAPKLQRIPEHVRLRELDLEMREGDFLATAQKCFEHREFRRAVYWLHECHSAKALFLSIYSQYMVLYDLVFRPRRLDLILSRNFLGGREASIERVEQIFKYASVEVWRS